MFIKTIDNDLLNISFIRSLYIVNQNDKFFVCADMNSRSFTNKYVCESNHKYVCIKYLNDLHEKIEKLNIYDFHQKISDNKKEKNISTQQAKNQEIECKQKIEDKSEEFAIKKVLHLLETNKDQFFTCNEVSKFLNSSYQFACRVLKQIREKNLCLVSLVNPLKKLSINNARLHGYKNIT